MNMINFFKVILSVVISVFVWFVGCTLLTLAAAGIPAFLISSNPDIEPWIDWLLGNKFADHLILVICRGLPMLLAAWITYKLHNESKACYTASAAITVVIIIAMQVYGYATGESNLLWLLEGAFVQVVCALIFRDEY